MGLVLVAYQRGGPPELPPGPERPEPRPAPRVEAAAPPDAAPEDVSPVAPPPPPPRRVDVPRVSPTEVAPAPAPAAPTFPEQIALVTPIERPVVGSGIGDRVQFFPIRPADLDRPAAVTGLRLHVPPTRAAAGGGGAGGGRTENVYASDGQGTVTGVTEARGGRPGVAIKWRATADPTSTVEVAYVAFDRGRSGVELAWHSAPLLKNPGLTSLLYWLLQNCTLELEGAREKSQQVAFRRHEPAAAALADAVTPLKWPVDLPAETAVVPPRLSSLPGGWEASWYTDWEVKEAALRTAANAAQVVRFKKPTPSAAVDAWFLVTFKAGLGTAECTFGKRRAADQAELERYESELRAITAQVEDVKKQNNGVMPDSQGSRDMLTRQEQLKQLAAAYRAAVAAYDEITQFDIAFDLPEGLRLATLRFEAGKASETGK
jgi:hypothetical protein